MKIRELNKPLKDEEMNSNTSKEFSSFKEETFERSSPEVSYGINFTIHEGSFEEP